VYVIVFCPFSSEWIKMFLMTICLHPVRINRNFGLARLYCISNLVQSRNFFSSVRSIDSVHNWLLQRPVTETSRLEINCAVHSQSQQLKIGLCGTWRFITVFKEVATGPFPRSSVSIPHSHNLYLSSILILYFHLRQGQPSTIFPSYSRLKFCILLGFITVTIFVKRTNCEDPHYVISSILLLLLPS
jgi:hypothetical protein